MEEDEFHVGMNGLYDFSQLERLTGDVDIFHSTADAMNNKNIIFTAAKTAILVKEKRGDIFNAFYNYTLMTKPSLIEYRVFSLDELDKLYEFLTITEEFHLNN
ncbi:MAG: hypothetical protein MJK12_06170 [Colwellia sp.]|nr:hypothetical protein [Colwellia sp.]